VPAAGGVRVRPAVLLVLGGVSLYLLLPSLLAVFASWRSLAHLDWPFTILTLACEVTSWVCLWEVDRIALHTQPGPRYARAHDRLPCRTGSPSRR
jgi:uncharacterized membrane protein YbhN (UPF0104 family)